MEGTEGMLMGFAFVTLIDCASKVTTMQSVMTNDSVAIFFFI